MIYPSMSRKQYECIASVINKMQGNKAYFRYEVAQHFADELRHTNTQFNTNMFIEACGVSVEGLDTDT